MTEQDLVGRALRTGLLTVALLSVGSALAVGLRPGEPSAAEQWIRPFVLSALVFGGVLAPMVARAVAARGDQHGGRAVTVVTAGAAISGMTVNAMCLGAPVGAPTAALTSLLASVIAIGVATVALVFADLAPAA